MRLARLKRLVCAFSSSPSWQPVVDSGASLPGAHYEVIFDDGVDLIVVNKDAGLLTVPGVGEDKHDCLVARVQRDLDVPLVKACHRLDRDTSGLIALPRSQRAHRALSIAFQDRKVKKTYRGRVLGTRPRGEGEIDAPVGKLPAVAVEDRSPLSRPRLWGVVPDGRPSLTRFKVLATHDRSTSVELFPVTGRSHQLRVHLAHVGAPLLGDTVHGDDEAKAAASRLCLHASGLQFRHPATNRLLSFRSDPDFDNLVRPAYLLPSSLGFSSS